MNIASPHTQSTDPPRRESASARPENGASPEAPRPSDPRARYQLILDEFVELGREMAQLMVEEMRHEAEDRRAAREAAAAAPSDAAAAAATEDAPGSGAKRRWARDLAFHRVARAVRDCMEMSIELYDECEGRKERLDDQRKSAARNRRERRERLIERLVTAAIEDEAKDELSEFAESSEDDIIELVNERVEEEDIQRDLEMRPVSELVARICRRVQVEPLWEKWQEDYWAQEEARLRTPGSPYAEPPEAGPPEAGLEEAKPDEPEPAAAQPPTPGPAPGGGPEPAPRPPQPIRSFDRFRPLTPEEKQANEEHAARIRAICYNRYY